MSGFSSDLLDEFKERFSIYYRITRDDDYGGYISEWIKGASFDGILTEDVSITSAIAGIDSNKNMFGLKVEKDVPLQFHSVIRKDSDKRFFRITSGEVLKSPRMSRLNMKILSCEAYEPTDWTEPEEVITNGNS